MATCSQELLRMRLAVLRPNDYGPHGRACLTTPGASSARPAANKRCSAGHAMVGGLCPWMSSVPLGSVRMA